eukprot:TRINITY_DN3342_c0_g1_i1.p1 TRINITY_DN3342_c0_g1~~TRINITY_DN3342_c0_g1_i1.p1  ORF type:complete len:202 (+),score=70.74 TRINITY_DN3342_c0_g1_i1:145-750(+)
MIRSQEKTTICGTGGGGGGLLGSIDGAIPFSWMDSSPGDTSSSSGTPPSSLPMTNKKKIKLEAERIYDSDGYWLRAACVCVRADSEGEVLLVSSSGRPESWIIPGGKMKASEAPEASAVREAMEEAGVVGDLGRFLGSFDNPERKHRTKVFVLRVTALLEEFEDKDSRRRSWFPIDDAIQLLHPYKPNHCKYLNALKQTQP